MADSRFLEWDANDELADLFRFGSDFPPPKAVEDECAEHGRLPFDAWRDPDCHCWDDLECA